MIYSYNEYTHLISQQISNTPRKRLIKPCAVFTARVYRQCKRKCRDGGRENTLHCRNGQTIPDRPTGKKLTLLFHVKHFGWGIECAVQLMRRTRRADPLQRARVRFDARSHMLRRAPTNPAHVSMRTLMNYNALRRAQRVPIRTAHNCHSASSRDVFI